jgi:hypothetical protein
MAEDERATRPVGTKALAAKQMRKLTRQTVHKTFDEFQIEISKRSLTDEISC